jgi:hypothetical protein
MISKHSYSASSIALLVVLLGGCATANDEAVCDGYAAATEDWLLSILEGENSNVAAIDYADALKALETDASPELAEELKTQYGALYTTFELSTSESRIFELCEPYFE